MPVSQRTYIVTGESLPEVKESFNFHLQDLADRLDKIEGWRGGSSIESDLDMNDQTINNVDIAATGITADTGTITDLTATTLAIDDITMTGDMFFTGEASGLTYGEISVLENSTPTTITSATVAVQVTVFDTNGHFHHCTPDHTENHILIDRAGHYLILVSSTVESVSGSSSKFEFEVMKNNGTTLLIPHVDRNIAGGGGSAGVISLSGFAELSVGDTVECWLTNETNTANYIVEDISLAILQIGGV